MLTGRCEFVDRRNALAGTRALWLHHWLRKLAKKGFLLVFWRLRYKHFLYLTALKQILTRLNYDNKFNRRLVTVDGPIKKRDSI